jgi:hypothetical protein
MLICFATFSALNNVGWGVLFTPRDFLNSWGTSVSERSTGVAQRRKTSAAMNAGVPGWSSLPEIRLWNWEMVRHVSSCFISPKNGNRDKHACFRSWKATTIEDRVEVLRSGVAFLWTDVNVIRCDQWFVETSNASSPQPQFRSSKRMGQAKPKSASLATPLASTPLVISVKRRSWESLYWGDTQGLKGWGALEWIGMIPFSGQGSPQVSAIHRSALDQDILRLQVSKDDLLPSEAVLTLDLA